jgi:hypothetical protein
MICYVKKKILSCVSKVEMSPLTAKLKCPHGTGEDTHGAEAVTEVASDEDGGGREDHLKGGRGKDRCVLQAGQADWTSNPGERDERVSSWQSGSALQPSDRGVITEEGFRTVEGGLLGL